MYLSFKKIADFYLVKTTKKEFKKEFRKVLCGYANRKLVEDN